MPWGSYPESMRAAGFDLLFGDHEPDERAALVEHSLATLTASLTTDQPHQLLGLWDSQARACLLVSQSGPTAFLVGDPALALQEGPLREEQAAELLSCLEQWVLDRVALATPDGSQAIEPPRADESAALRPTAGAPKSAGPVMIQLMLSDPRSEDWEPRLLRAGWEKATRLYYLEARLADLPIDDSPGELSAGWIPANRLSRDSLEQLVRETHIDSQDCRFLKGRRSVDEMIAGYESSTQSGREWWEVLQVDSTPAACLLAGLQNEGRQIEWVYLGVAARFRRQGLGRQVVEHGLARARQLQVESIVLGLDEANLPALRLYAAANFRAWDRRTVFLKWLPGDRTSRTPSDAIL
ncbi:MAG: GNAT family N-acetyltransferase [Planctomycetales bacterium]|nr:GNAT family N-acetyltransferase [Planctomycetales bacterium]